MTNETTTTVAGNLTADPELRLTPTGRAVAIFTVASTTRALDATTGEWRDGDTLFLRCTAWRRLAENVAESVLRRGTRVVVTGRLQQRVYETDDGQKRSTIELVADDDPATRDRAPRTVENGADVGQAVPATPQQVARATPVTEPGRTA